VSEPSEIGRPVLPDEKIENHSQHRQEEHDEKPQQLMRRRPAAAEDVDDGDDVEYKESWSPLSVDKTSLTGIG
jgi:hypothetical protein